MSNQAIDDALYCKNRKLQKTQKLSKEQQETADTIMTHIPKLTIEELQQLFSNRRNFNE